MKVRVMLVKDGKRKRQVVVLDQPGKVHALMRKRAERLDREHFWRIDVDTRSQYLGYETVSVGTLSASLVHPREVFKGALLNNAAAIIIMHNHPSGEVSPSPEDVEATRRLSKVGELIGVPLLDHVIVAGESYYSLKEHGKM